MKKLLYITLLFLGLTSCVDDKYNFQNLDSTMQIDADFVGPLAYSKVNLVDVLNVDSLGELEINIKGDTMYLGAATKASTSQDRRLQPFSDEPAKPRAFSISE